MASMVAMPAAQARQLPPKVEACLPGTRQAAISARAIIAADGGAAAEGLGHRDDVRLDVEMLVAEPLAGPAHAGLDLVEDHHGALLVAEPADRPEELGASRR